MTNDVGRKARSGIKLTFAATVAQGLAQLGFMIVLARLLSPNDYGYYAVALSVSAMTIGLVSGAIERALIVQPATVAIAGQSATILALLVAAAAITLGVCTALASTTSWALDPGVLAIICGTQALMGAAIIPRVLLRRELAFGRIVLGELGGMIVGSGGVAILLALSGMGAYALALGFFAQNMISLGILLLTGRPAWSMPNVDSAKRLLRSASTVGKLASLEIFNVQAPAILLSVRFGAAQLGLYNRVSNIVTLPVQLLTSSMSRVMVSAMVAVADDRPRLARAAGLMVSVSTAIITPIALGIAGSAHAFVDTLLGKQWLAAVPLVPALAAMTWSAMIAQTLAVVAEAAQAFKDKIRIQIVSSTGLLIATLIGSYWGLLGAAIGVALGNLLFLILQIALASRLLNTRVGQIVGWMAPGVGAGVVCFLFATAAGHYLRASPAIGLLAQIAGCAVGAPAYYLLLHRPLVTNILNAVLPDRLRRT